MNDIPTALYPLLVPLFENFPAQLVNAPQWVVWKGEWLPEKSKYNKIPFDAKTGKKASSTDPATWATFEQAKQCYQKGRGNFAGVGFVLSAEDAFAGVDLDSDCPQEKTDAWVALLDSYTEVSPSGKGLRVFVLAKLPPGDRKRGPVECYQEGRFLTVTGHVVEGTPVTIEERQLQVECFHLEAFPVKDKPKPHTERSGGVGEGLLGSDSDLISKACQAKNGGAFSALYSGDMTGYGSQSEADLALCNRLVFWTGPDPARLDRLFRDSGLYRDKWNESHHASGETYGEHTIAKAIAGCRTFYSPVISRNGHGSSSNGTVPGPKQKAQSEEVPVEQVDIPIPLHVDAKGQLEYGSYQIAELLGLDAESPSSNRAMAYRAKTFYEGSLYHCAQLGFVVWNGKHWQCDGKKDPATAARFVKLSGEVRKESAKLFGYVSDLFKKTRLGDAEAMQKAAYTHLKHIKIAESQSFAQDAMLLSQDSFRCRWEQFDVHPFVLGFANGTWDKGEFREHRREDFLLNHSPMVYDRDADRTEWNAILERITGGDADFAQTLQDVAGYCFSGASHIRLLPWCYGPTGTGKGTFSEMLLTALGDQSATIDPTKLQLDSSRERLGADIWNKRVAICAEAGNQRLDPELLKTLSGSDVVPVRYLYNEAFKANPTHVLVMIANDAPNITAYDDALKNRVIALPFDHPLSEGPPIKLSGGGRLEGVRRNPKSKLLIGFTAWAVDGMKRVLDSQDVYRAENTKAATVKFWKDTDILSEFWDEWRIMETRFDDYGKPYLWQTQTKLIDQLQAGLLKSEVRKQYEHWCLREGVRKTYSPRQWAAACKSRGLTETFDTGGYRMWKIPALSLPILEDFTDTTDTTD